MRRLAAQRGREVGTLNTGTRGGMISKLALTALVLGLAFAWTSCHRRRPVVIPGPPPSAPRGGRPAPSRPAPIVQGEEGVASWYGPHFNGRRTSSGEIFNMYAMTAAHRTLPFGTRVRVHDLENGQSVVVRINDRGPFVEGRIIDLSYAAAQAMHMTGTALVRLEILGLGPGAANGNYAVQVGAFADWGNAERLKRLIEPRYSPVTILTLSRGQQVLYRVLVGQVTSEGQALSLERKLIEAGLATQAFVVRLN